MGRDFDGDVGDLKLSVYPKGGSACHPRSSNEKSRVRALAGGSSQPKSYNMDNAIHSYTDLQRQIHDDLRLQHPEWIQSNGDCPTCDSYESRLAELLGLTRGSNTAGMKPLPFLGHAHDF